VIRPQENFAVRRAEAADDSGSRSGFVFEEFAYPVIDAPMGANPATVR
jgi:hypothetical protein